MVTALTSRARMPLLCMLVIPGLTRWVSMEQFDFKRRPRVVLVLMDCWMACGGIGDVPGESELSASLHRSALTLLSKSC